MATIPDFQADGLLPPGDYEVSFAELRQSILVVGPGNPTKWPNWDAAWRATLVANLEKLTRQLWQIGITEVFADGSFAEDKDHPNDIDGYFVCDLDRLKSGELTRELNLLDPARSGRGTRRHAGHIAGIRRSSFRCGTATASSCIRMSRGWAWVAVSVTSTAMNWNSPPHSVSPDATGRRGASSKSAMEVRYDSQRG